MATKMGMPKISLTQEEVYKLQREKRMAQMPKVIIVKRTPLKKVSQKQARENAECNKVVKQLRELCGDKSEIPGVMEYKRNSHNTEPHHLKGRVGKNLINPFCILMLFANQHDYRQKHLKETREADLQLVREIRLKQGFKEKDYK